MQAELKLEPRGCNVMHLPQRSPKQFKKPIRNRGSESTSKSRSQTPRPWSSQAPVNNFTQYQQTSPRVAQQQQQLPSPRVVSCIFPSTPPSNTTVTDGGRSSEYSNLSYELHFKQLGKLDPLPPTPFPFRFSVRLRLIL